ncbi:hypothetical protein JCM9279_000154 [Rhodotorula babjevae]
MPPSPYKHRQHARFLEPYGPTYLPVKHSRARQSLPLRPTAPVWGQGAARASPARRRAPVSDEGDLFGLPGGLDSDGEDGWALETDSSQDVSVVEQAFEEPSRATEHAASAIETFTHTSLYSTVPSDDFNIVASSAMKETKTILRLAAETAGPAFRDELNAVEAAEEQGVEALTREQDKLVGAAQQRAAQVKALLHRLAELQHEEEANRASTRSDLQAIRKDTEATLAAAAKKHADASARLAKELQALYGHDGASGASGAAGSVKGRGAGAARGKAPKSPARKKH